MMKSILAAACLIFAVTAQAREIALTFDDCPRRTGKLMTGMDRAKKLTDTLKKSGVKQVAFFCNSPSKQPDGPERLKFFADQGHTIANHSSNHLDLNKTPAEEYAKDIDTADAELKDLSNFRKWFRFPFLREGDNPQKINAIRNHLQAAGYTNGYVTVDNQDWYMDVLFNDGVNAGRKYDSEKLCDTYKKMLVEDAIFYDTMSVKALGRSVKHVMLLHETDLNALCIGEVISGLRAKNFKIISPDEAYQDSIALREPSVSVPLNQGRVHALAKERGYKGSYYSKWNEEENIRREFDRAGIWE